MNHRTTLATAITMVLASAFSPGKVNAQADAAVVRSVEGVWMVTTTPRNCITGNPIPGAAFEGLFTFHKDGTMSAWVQNSVITLTRSPSHGLWQRDLGWSNYSFAFVHLRYELSGTYSGRQEARGTLELNASGDGFATDSTIAVFDVNGIRLGGGCANSVGTRLDSSP